MSDPHAPTPGTENEPGIDYDAIEKLARDFVRIYGEFRCDLAAVLFLVRKARQRDAAEKEIEARIIEDDERSEPEARDDHGAIAARAEALGLRFALAALRREK